MGGWTLEGEPYTQRAGHRSSTGSATRMLGGRTNHWGRISLRFGPDDFRRKSLDGLGDDWPITYDDLKPYYDKVDRLVGIFGIGRRPAERARRHLSAAAEAALLRAADQAGGGHAEHPVHPDRACRSSRSRSTAGRPATTAANAGADARRTRISRRRRCCCRRRWRPAG